MNNSLRRQVLQSFKKLHRARQFVFEEDEFALKAGREKINAEYKKCKQITDETSIKEMVKFARDVEQELKASVVQAREVKPGKYGLTPPETYKPRPRVRRLLGSTGTYGRSEDLKLGGQPIARGPN